MPGNPGSLRPRPWSLCADDVGQSTFSQGVPRHERLAELSPEGAERLKLGVAASGEHWCVRQLEAVSERRYIIVKRDDRPEVDHTTRRHRLETEPDDGLAEQVGDEGAGSDPPSDRAAVLTRRTRHDPRAPALVEDEHGAVRRGTVLHGEGCAVVLEPLDALDEVDPSDQLRRDLLLGHDLRPASHHR